MFTHWNGSFVIKWKLCSTEFHQAEILPSNYSLTCIVTFIHKFQNPISDHKQSAFCTDNNGDSMDMLYHTAPNGKRLNSSPIGER